MNIIKRTLFFSVVKANRYQGVRVKNTVKELIMQRRHHDIQVNIILSNHNIYNILSQIICCYIFKIYEIT